MVGALLVALWPQERSARGIALLVSTLTVVVVALLISAYHPELPGIQLEEGMTGSLYKLGVDGLSLPLLGLTAGLGWVAVLLTPLQMPRPRARYAWMLLLEGAVLGVFLAQDWALFYIFFELTLIPLFFLIGLWGGARRAEASLTFLLYTMGGSVVTLLALLTLKLLLGEESFGMASMAEGARLLSPHAQAIALMGLSVGFLVKLPSVPLHGWLPLAYGQAPASVAVMLSGVMVKMGAYGLIRGMVALPEGARILAPYGFALGAMGVLYGALLAWREGDLRQMVAWSSVSHMGVVLMGLCTLSVTGLSGAVLQMIAHGAVMGLLFTLVGRVDLWTGTRRMDALGPLADRAPRAAAGLGLALLCSTGLPGTASFVAELQVLVAGWERYGLGVGVASLGAIVWTAAVVRALDRLLFGKGGEAQPLPDLGRTELMGLVPLVLILIIFGIDPQLCWHLSIASLREMVHFWELP